MLDTIEEIKAAAVETLTRLGFADLAPRLRVRWEPRYTRTVASARYRRTSHCRIRVSVHLWLRAADDQKANTVVHEVCHLVVDHLTTVAGRPPEPAHGKAWRRLMVIAGAPPERCTVINDYGIARGPGTRKPLEGRCACRSHWCSRRTAKRINTGELTWSCRACGGEITLV